MAEVNHMDTLRGHSFEQKMRLLVDICAEHGVEFLGVTGPIVSPKKSRTLVTKRCKIHGDQQVRARQLIEKGVFHCEQCRRESGKPYTPHPDAVVRAARRRKYLNSKAAGGKIKLVCDQNEPRKVYVMVTPDEKYMKIGVTARCPVTRMNEVNQVADLAKSGIQFDRVFAFSTNALKACVLETQLKAMMSDYIQTDLPKFPGSNEILSNTDKAKVSAAFKSSVASIASKVWRPQVNYKITEVKFGEGEIKFLRVKLAD